MSDAQPSRSDSKHRRFPRISNVFRRSSPKAVEVIDTSNPHPPSTTGVVDRAHTGSTTHNTSPSASQAANNVAQVLSPPDQAVQSANHNLTSASHLSRDHGEHVSVLRPYSDRLERLVEMDRDKILGKGPAGEASLLPDHVPDIFQPVLEPPSSDVVSRDSPVPSRIACRLALVVDKIDTQYHERLFFIKWQESQDHKLCFERAHEHLKAQMKGNQKFYETSRQLRILEHIPRDDLPPSGHETYPTGSESGVTTSFHVLDFLFEGDHRERQLHAEDIKQGGEEAWQEILPQKLVQQFTESWDARVFVELRATYTTFHPHICDLPRDCRAMVTSDLKEKRVSHDTVHPEICFIPRTFLNEYFQKSLIEHLIDVGSNFSRDIDWKLSGEESLATLVSNIALWGSRLFALCIYAEVSLDRFFLMWHGGRQDEHLPMEHEEIDRWVGQGSKESLEFRMAQKMFRAHQFPPRDTQHEDKPIAKMTILPFTSKVKIETQGANGKVYKVQIHEEHHSFLPDRSAFLAVKKLGPANTGIDFSQEIRSSKQFSAVPNRHLTPLLASWIHGGKFYMLFPWAEHNLLYLLEERSSPLQDDLVEWFLGQIAGLAAAVDQIHNLRRAKPENKAQHTAWHHDLKPSNILLFSDGTLKITDFGTAQISKRTSSDFRDNKSPKTPQAVGDWDYDSPDYELYEDISRSYDIFALGCIFVEMLLWLFGKGGQQLKDFRHRRLQEAEGRFVSLNTSPFKSANFWYRVKHKDCELKKVVFEEIEYLESRGKDKYVFKWLVMLIRNMLSIRREQRPISASVSSELHYLHQQAILDIRDHRKKNLKKQQQIDDNSQLQDFFKLAAAPSSKFFGPPSSIVWGVKSTTNQSSPDSPAAMEVPGIPFNPDRPTLPDIGPIPSSGPEPQFRAFVTTDASRHHDIISSGQQFEIDPVPQRQSDILNLHTGDVDNISNTSSQIYFDATDVVQVRPVPTTNND